MKLKDIKIGEVYAIGAPNVSYGAPFPAKVVKVGVHGEVSSTGGWGHHSSTRANYVEIEPTTDKGSGHRYSCRVDEAGRLCTGSLGRRDAPGSTRVQRCMGSHVLRLWGDQEVLNEANANAEAKAQERKAKELASKEAIVERFKAQGIEVYIRRTGFEFYSDGADTILEALEGKS